MIDRLESAVAERFNGLPAWVVVTQLFLGLGWARAAMEKVIDADWWSGEVLSSFVGDHEMAIVGWYEPIVGSVIDPYWNVVLVLVVVLQLIAAGSMVSGRVVGLGLAAGIFLNLNFVAAGAVNPSAFYLLSQGALALWLCERTVDRDPRWLRWSAIGGLTFAALSAPFIRTLEPAGVIDDAAVMLVTGGLLTVVACELAHRSTQHGVGLP